jgi:hypothetical protein
MRREESAKRNVGCSLRNCSLCSLQVIVTRDANDGLIAQKPTRDSWVRILPPKMNAVRAYLESKVYVVVDNQRSVVISA